MIDSRQNYLLQLSSMKKPANPKNSIQDKVLKKLDEIEKEIKLLDEKGKSSERSLSLRIMSEGANIREELKRSIGAEIQLAAHETGEILQERLTDFSDKMFTKIDPLLKELVDNREDRALASDESEEFKRKLGNHEKRIAKLEDN